MIFMAIADVVVFSSFVLACLKTALVVPRDQPIRLNMKRQSIFVYKYKKIVPFPLLKWPVIITCYHWADVHGEIRYCSDRYRSGYQLWGSVCEPGTYNVIHRFQLADGEPAELHQIWSYLCLYMKGEPVPQEAVNKGRPDSWRPRKADKWPADMELESTTAPHDEQPTVSHQKALSDSAT